MWHDVWKAEQSIDSQRLANTRFREKPQYDHF
jgi:hypothetical protein